MTVHIEFEEYYFVCFPKSDAYAVIIKQTKTKPSAEINNKYKIITSNPLHTYNFASTYDLFGEYKTVQYACIYLICYTLINGYDMTEHVN